MKGHEQTNEANFVGSAFYGLLRARASPGARQWGRTASSQAPAPPSPRAAAPPPDRATHAPITSSNRKVKLLPTRRVLWTNMSRCPVHNQGDNGQNTHSAAHSATFAASADTNSNLHRTSIRLLLHQVQNCINFGRAKLIQLVGVFSRKTPRICMQKFMCCHNSERWVHHTNRLSRAPP